MSIGQIASSLTSITKTATGKENFFEFSEAPVSVPQVPGVQSWNPEALTLDTHIGFDGIILQNGQEEYYPPVLNDTGSLIPNGTVVGFAGANSELKISPYIADGSISAQYIVGVVTADIADGDVGIVTKFGYIHDVNASGSGVSESWAVGDILYASPTTAGKFTKVRPAPPNVEIPIAAVIDNSSTDGVLLVRVYPQHRLYYGVFSSTQTQTATVSTPTGITYNTTDISSGVYYDPDNPSRIYCTNAGLYNFQFSLQVTSSSSNTQEIAIWSRIDGNDVANSATCITIQSNTAVIVPAWNFVYSMQAGQYFELIWATDHANVSLTAEPATTTPYIRPAIPSVILTVTQVNQ